MEEEIKIIPEEEIEQWDVYATEIEGEEVAVEEIPLAPETHDVEEAIIEEE